MNGDQSTNYKFKALLILLLCLFVPDLKLHSKQEGYLKNFIYNRKKDTALRFSSTDKIIRFQEKDLVARYNKSISQIENSLIEIFSISYLLSRGEREFLYIILIRKSDCKLSRSKIIFLEISLRMPSLPRN